MSEQEATSAPEVPESFSDPRQAVNWMMAQEKPQADTNSSAERAETATAETRSAEQADVARPEEAPRSETEGRDPAELPPVERPRSWSKEDESVWNGLPRAAQEKLAAREQARETELRRVQNEAAEARKAAEATRTQVEQKAQIGERVQTLQRELDELTFVNNSQFGIIKSQADLDTLSAEQMRLADSDPVGAGKIGAFLNAWQAHQYKMHAKSSELQQAQSSQTSEVQTKWAQHVNEENTKFESGLSDSDRAEIVKMREEAPAFLQKLGFTQHELQDLADGKSKLSIYDHRMQGLIRNSMKLERIEAAAAKAKAAPVPPVQRPGARAPGGQNQSALQKATQDFNLNPTARTAAALRIARTNAARH